MNRTQRAILCDHNVIACNPSLIDFGKKRKKSRWSSETPDQKTVIPGMPTVIPPGLTRDQERAYIGEYLYLYSHTVTSFCYEVAENDF